MVAGSTVQLRPHEGSRTTKLASPHLSRSIMCQATVCPASVQSGSPVYRWWRSGTSSCTAR
jgi:hypothetical protein